MTITSPHLGSSQEWTDAHLLFALEEVVEKELNRHLKVAKDWMPHEYVPFSDGRNFPGVFEDGEAWQADQSKVSDIGKIALVVNLLTEDNLPPSYHHEIASLFGRDGAWGTWVHRWTAEEGRHGIVMRDYLLTSRAVDPDKLEQFRMAHMAEGFESDNRHSMLHSVAYVASRSWRPASRTATPGTSRATRSATACWRASRPTRTCTWSSTATSWARPSSWPPRT